MFAVLFVLGFFFIIIIIIIIVIITIIISMTVEVNLTTPVIRILLTSTVARLSHNSWMIVG